MGHPRVIYRPQRGRHDEGPSKGPFGLALAEGQLLLLHLFRLLSPDVVADDIFRQSDRAHTAPFRPEVVARKVAWPPEILSVDPDADFPFRNPTVVTTLNFGGMPNSRCT